LKSWAIDSAGFGRRGGGARQANLGIDTLQLSNGVEARTCRDAADRHQFGIAIAISPER
jgi:hypothetical protein